MVMAMESSFFADVGNFPPQMSPQDWTRREKVKYMFHCLDRDRDGRLSKVSGARRCQSI